MRYETSFQIGDREISLLAPSYFVADIAANHDGDLQRAKDLIQLRRGTPAPMRRSSSTFAPSRSSAITNSVAGRPDRASGKMGEAGIRGSYADYSLNRDWNHILAETAVKARHSLDGRRPTISTPLNWVMDLLPAFKISSGDITWPAFIEYVASKGKPMLVATDAATMSDVEAAVEAVLRTNRKLCLMQCNTNYTGSLENLRHVNLRVLQAYALHWPGLPLGRVGLHVPRRPHRQRHSAARAGCRGTARSLYRRRCAPTLQERSPPLVEGTARLYGATAKISYSTGYPVVVNHERQTAFAADVAREITSQAKSMPTSRR